jgi:aminopeptidase N
MRPEEWQRIIDTERGHLTSDLLRQEFDYVSRACTPDHSSQLSLFNALLKPENRQHEPWALHVLRLLNADVREPGSNVYIPSSLNSLEYLQQTSDIFFSSDWLAALLAGHKSAEARQQVEQFLRDKPDLRPQLRNKILEAAWPLMNKRR